MTGKFCTGAESLLAIFTNESLVLAVKHFMTFETLFVGEALVADVALERFVCLVCAFLVLLEFIGGEEFSIAVLTSVTQFITMNLLVTLK